MYISSVVFEISLVDLLHVHFLGCICYPVGDVEGFCPRKTSALRPEIWRVPEERNRANTCERKETNGETQIQMG